MNKIYKVVWSKAKHCYVVTSELAKRNGKGCGTHSLRMAAVSMGVAAALLCTGHSLFGMPVASAEVKEVTWDGSLTSSQTPTNVTPDNAAMELSGTPKVYAHITDTYVTQGYKTLTLIPGDSWRNHSLRDGRLQ